MGQGRKSKPNEIKAAQGSLNVSRLRKSIIQPTIEVNAEPPQELNEWGQSLYKSIMNEYASIGLVTRVDTGSLLMLCNEFGSYCEADDIIKAKGMEVDEPIFDKGVEVGNKRVVNPMLKARNDAFKNYKSMCVEFGLTPSSRATLNTPQKKEHDPIADILES